VVTWYDYRGGIQTDIYAQRITSAGQVAPGWTVNGVALCTAVADQQSPTLVGGSNGGALVAWQDYRNNSDYDIYAQYVTGTGYVPLAVDVPDPGAGLPSFHVQEPRPNPASGVATIAFELPATRTVDARVFDLGGRAVRVLETGRSFSAGAHVLAWDGRDQGGGRVATGVYLVRLTAGSEVQVRRVVRLR
jgi:hypothetical protein